MLKSWKHMQCNEIIRNLFSHYEVGRSFCNCCILIVFVWDHIQPYTPGMCILYCSLVSLYHNHHGGTQGSDPEINVEYLYFTSDWACWDIFTPLKGSLDSGED